MSTRGGIGGYSKGRSRASNGSKDVEMSGVTSHPIAHPQPASTYYRPETDSASAPSPSDRVSINSLTGATPTPSQSRSLLNDAPSPSNSSPSSFTVPPASPTSRATPVNRASATPSISSLIDPVPTPVPVSVAAPPPPAPAPAPARSSGTKRTSTGTAVQNGGARSVAATTSAASSSGTTKASTAPAPSNTNTQQHPPILPPPPAAARTTPPKSKETTAPNSSAPSPKPVKEKVEKTVAAPIPRGNGLLSGTMFSNKPGENDTPEVPTIIIHVPLQGETNKYVNFSKLAEEKYGWAALHPALAKMKEALGDASMSGDERDGSDSDSAEDKMAVDSEPPAAPEKPARKKRRMVDLYDATDPFIDDAESMWEEHAAATKDGFFVYSGPLIREGEVAMVERADGTVKRGSGRGRGRGRGRGGASGVPRKPRTVKPKKDKVEKLKEEGKAAAAAMAAAAAAARG